MTSSEADDLVVTTQHEESVPATHASSSISIATVGEIPIRCTDCLHSWYTDCIYDRTYKCTQCKGVILGVNANKDYRQRTYYYYKALEEEVMPVVMPSTSSKRKRASRSSWRQQRPSSMPSAILQLIAAFCADVPVFKVGDLADYTDSHKHMDTWAQSKVLAVEFGAYERIEIEIGSGTKNLSGGFSSKEKKWLRVYEEYHDAPQTLIPLNLFWPSPETHAVRIRCGLCKLILWSKIERTQYLIGEPLQQHFSFQLYTNVPPNKNAVREVQSGKINCIKNCHWEPLHMWLIENGSSTYFDRHGYEYLMPCGRTYNVVEQYIDQEKEMEELANYMQKAL